MALFIDKRRQLELTESQRLGNVSKEATAGLLFFREEDQAVTVAGNNRRRNSPRGRRTFLLLH